MKQIRPYFQWFSVLMLTAFIRGTQLSVEATEGFLPSLYVSEKFGPAINEFATKWSVVVNGVLGFAILTSVLCLVVQFMKLGITSGNPGERQKVVKDLIIVAICTALLGSSGTLWYIVMYTAF